MPSLADLLVTAKPQETSGARSANRADYQKDWALCLLLRLQGSGKDYLLLLEHHDDVSVLDSATNPSKVRFFQLKTASKPWTMKALVQRAKGHAGPKPSILGKMFANGKLFDPDVERLALVSNAHFRFTMADGSSGESLTDICFVQICDAEKTSARKSLVKELAVTAPLPWEGITFFLVDDLSVKDHATHARGKVSAFLEKIGKGEIAVGAIYRTLVDELRRRADHEGNCLTLPDLASRKGISREVFTEMLAKAAAGVSGRAWENCRTQLIAEQVPYTRIKKLQFSWNTHEVYRMDAANLGIQKLRAEITLHLDQVAKAADDSSLLEMVESIALKVTTPPQYTEDDVRGAVLLEAYVKEQCGAVQEADQKSKETGA